MHTLYVCMYVCIYVCARSMCVCMYEYMYVCACMHVCSVWGMRNNTRPRSLHELVHVCMRIFMHVCMFV